MMRTLGIDLAAQPKHTEAALPKRDHDLGALICALVARAVATGRTERPSPEQAKAAAREGWIHIPACPSGELVSG